MRLKKFLSKIALAFGVTWCASFGLASDQIPGAKQTRTIVIIGATVHTVSGDTIENGNVVFSDGKITAVGRSVAFPADAERLDAKGAHVYPSLIDANSPIGLVEIESVRATIDHRETGENNANVRAVAAFNPDSELIPVARANGLLVALTAPSGGLISGRSSLMMLDGWNAQDMTLQTDCAMHINWPRMTAPNAGSGRANDDLESLNQLFSQSQRYTAVRAADATQAVDLRLEALAKTLDGKMPIIVAATSVAQIQSAVAFAKQWKLRLIVFGGYEAPECADLLRRENVPVIVSGVYRLPSHRHSAYDSAYTLPQRLHAAGVQFCISATERFGASNLRNLPYHAATAAAYGLSEQGALRAITLSPAEILGVADRVGAIKVGNDATLFIANGNILETPTQVTHAFVQGRRVDLDNRHKQLYRKYTEKYDRQKTSP